MYFLEPLAIYLLVRPNHTQVFLKCENGQKHVSSRTVRSKNELECNIIIFFSYIFMMTGGGGATGVELKIWTCAGMACVSLPLLGWFYYYPYMLSNERELYETSSSKNYFFLQFYAGHRFSQRAARTSREWKLKGGVLNSKMTSFVRYDYEAVFIIIVTRITSYLIILSLWLYMCVYSTEWTSLHLAFFFVFDIITGDHHHYIAIMRFIFITVLPCVCEDDACR